jgi:hypothetical protein
VSAKLVVGGLIGAAGLLVLAAAALAISVLW